MQAVDSIPSFQIRCPCAQLQTACEPWMGSQCHSYEACSGLPGEFATAHVRAQTRHPHSPPRPLPERKASCAQRTCCSRRHQSTLWDSYSPTLECRNTSPIRSSTSRPSQRRRAARAEERRVSVYPAPLDRERDLACSKLVVTHLSSRQVVSRRRTSSEVWLQTDCTAISCMTP